MATADRLRVYIMNDARRADLIAHEQWLEVERNADAVRLLIAQFKLKTGPFKETV